MQTPLDTSYLADSVILFRYFETEGTVRQAISVLKKRSGKHEKSIRVLILAPTRRDSEITSTILMGEKVTCHTCSNLEEFCDQLQQGAGVGILTEEILTTDVNNALPQILKQQPPWSDFPLLVLTPAGELSSHEIRTPMHVISGIA